MCALAANAEAEDTAVDVVAGRLAAAAALAEEVDDEREAAAAAAAAAAAEAEEDARENGSEGGVGRVAKGAVRGNARDWAGSRDSTNDRKLSHSSVVQPSRLSVVSLGHTQV